MFALRRPPRKPYPYSAPTDPSTAPSVIWSNPSKRGQATSTLSARFVLFVLFVSGVVGFIVGAAYHSRSKALESEQKGNLLSEEASQTSKKSSIVWSDERVVMPPTLSAGAVALKNAAAAAKEKSFLAPQRPKSPIQGKSLYYTHLIEVNPEYKVAEAESPDYKNPVYDAEAAALRAQVSAPGSAIDELTAVLDESVLLMTRAGHRRRLIDLIGARVDLTVAQSRAELAKADSFKGLGESATSDRDYQTKPIGIRSGGLSKKSDCPELPCKSHCYSGETVCDAQRESFTMENYPNSPWWQSTGGRLELQGTTRLESLVPVPYFSWHDFGVMEKVKFETAQRNLGIAAAFISNCGYRKRNAMVVNLAASLGVDKIHSYGACARNAQEPRATGHNANDKLDTLRRHKFSLAFENSETKDYVTEKFFGPLCVGAVPVVIGAPNIKFYAPDTGPYPYESNAMIHADDVRSDSELLAKLLLALDSDDAAFESMLEWKKTGYSVDFEALIDLTEIPSQCRSCIYLADALRSELGPNKYDVASLRIPADSEGEGLGHKSIFVRERGTYIFTKLVFTTKLTLRGLIAKTITSIQPRPKNLWLNNANLRSERFAAANKDAKFSHMVYAFYTHYPRRPVLSDEDLNALPQGAELECIFVQRGV